MTLCTITGWQCHCQPPEIPCDGLKELREAYADWRRKAEQAKRELSLAEEGLANYAQEVERLQKKLLEDMTTIQSQGDEIERLRGRCAALAFLHYGGPSPSVDPPSAEHPTGNN